MKKKKVCMHCHGFGLHAHGEPSALTAHEAAEGMPSVKCPMCKESANPVFKKAKKK